MRRDDLVERAMAESERAYREQRLYYASLSEAELDAAAVAYAESDTIMSLDHFPAQVEFRKRWVRDEAEKGRRILASDALTRPGDVPLSGQAGGESLLAGAARA